MGSPENFVGNFRAQVKDIVESNNLVWKQQWLSSIWFARDHLRHQQGLDLEDRDPLAQAFITRFNLRKKRRRAVE